MMPPPPLLSSVSLFYKILPVKVMGAEHTLSTVTVGLAAESVIPLGTDTSLLPSPDTQRTLLSAPWWRVAVPGL